MSKDLKRVLTGTGFYAALAVCLLAAGISGYFLLFDRTETAVETPVTVETPAVEAVSPEPLPAEKPEVAAPAAAEAPAMPEAVIDPTPIVAQAPRLIVEPVRGQVLTAFSVDELVYSETLDDWRVHAGVDIAAKPGTTVLAACSGAVVSVMDDALMGTTVTIEHDGGYVTSYSNLQARPNVEAGDAVSAGQIIGAVGATAAAEAAQAPHLHFSVTKNGVVMDPGEFLEQ